MDSRPPRYAFFDLDGTLLPWDTQILFCNHVLRAEGWRRVLMLPFLLCLPLAALRLVRSRGMKRLFLGYLAGATPSRLDAWAESFAREVAARHVWPEMRAQIEARRAEGCVLVLNTASPSVYAPAIARILGFHHCLATRVVPRPRQPLVPDFDGPNNKRAAKIDAMRRFGPLAPDTQLPVPGSWAYTDSPVDIPLLDCAEHGVLVHPAPAFAALAASRAWTVLRPQPALPRGRKVLSILAMLAGCWNPG